jgi:heptosyltransferase III
VVVHLGASTHEKCYSPENWVKVIRAFNASAKMPVTLIGSRDERALSETVAAQVASDHVRNFVGETQLHELFGVIGTAAVLVGADSAPVHIAALTNTPTLNLSSANVNFWETGPLAARSRVLYRENLQEIEPGLIACEARSMAAGFEPTEACAWRPDPLSPYVLCGLSFDNFRWNLIQALYTGTDYPTLTEKCNRLAMDRLFELSELALQQLVRWNELKDRTTAGKILAQIDEMFTDVAELNPNAEPVVQWFETQRLRIPPGPDTETLERTTKAFQDLYWVVSVYHKNADVKEVAAQAISLCRQVAPEFRDYNMQGVSDSFQNLVSALQELARHSTKVADISWSSVLDEMNRSLAARDYIQLADFLEWKMIPALISLESGA